MSGTIFTIQLNNLIKINIKIQMKQLINQNSSPFLTLSFFVFPIDLMFGCFRFVIFRYVRVILFFTTLLNNLIKMNL